MNPCTQNPSCVLHVAEAKSRIRAHYSNKTKQMPEEGSLRKGWARKSSMSVDSHILQWRARVSVCVVLKLRVGGDWPLPRSISVQRRSGLLWSRHLNTAPGERTELLKEEFALGAPTMTLQTWRGWKAQHLYENFKQTTPFCQKGTVGLFLGRGSKSRKTSSFPWTPKHETHQRVLSW